MQSIPNQLVIRFEKVAIVCALIGCTALFGAITAKANTSAAEASAWQSPLKVTAVTEVSSSLHQFSDSRHSASASFWLAPSVRVSEHYSLSGLFILDKELTGEEKLSLRNAQLTARRTSISLSEELKFSPAATLILPLNEDARDRESLVLGIKLAPRLLFDLDAWGLSPVSGHFQTSVTRNLHQFKTSTTGASNREWSWSNWLKFDFAIWRQLTLSTSAIYSYLWTYEGNQTGQFELSEEIAWDFSNWLSVAVGHSNSGNAVKANGLNSNIDVFDAENSIVYGSLSFTY